MNLEDLQKKLLASARTEQPSEHVPLAFEKRIMARIADLQKLPVPVFAWGTALWRACAPCVLVMVLLGGWSYFGSPVTAPTSGSDLSQDFENTVLAAVGQDSPVETVW